jgi:hypothetical protein
MTNHYRRHRRPSTRTTLDPRALHEAYIEAVNAAIGAGQESTAHELAAEYLEHRRDLVGVSATAGDTSTSGR